MEQKLKSLIPHPSRVADAMGVSYGTVNNWIQNNTVPPKRARALAEALDIELRELLEFIGYAPSRAAPAIIKSEDELEQLFLAWKGEPYNTALPQKSVALTLARWGENFGLLYETLHALKDRKISAAQAADRLGVAKSTIHGLRRRYGMAPGRPKSSAKDARKVSKREQEAIDEAVLEVISGRSSAVGAAKRRKINLRTLHRHIAPRLEPLSLNEISHWPGSFRRTLAWEIEHDHARLSAQWIERARQMRLILRKKARWPTMPSDARSVPIRELLVQWLGGEALELLARARGGEPAVLKSLFEQELANMGIRGVDALSSYHRTCAGELVLAFMSPHRSEAQTM